MRDESFETLSGGQLSIPIEDRQYIDGDFVSGIDEFPVESPALGVELARIPTASPDQVDAAVQAASEASESWRDLPVTERRERVEAFANVLETHRETLTTIDVADNGSSIQRLRQDMDKCLRTIRYFAGLATELKGQTNPTRGGNLNLTKREPYGVVAGIIPFNHPAMFTGEKIAPAVVAGNGIVIKPSEVTPLSALYIAHLIDEGDFFPHGLVNVVTGDGAVGSELVEHDDVGLVSMIGGAQTGKAVMEGAASNLTPVILELGGKNPVIVYPDADLDSAIDGAVEAMALPWQGQSCGSGSRLLVHTDVREEVVPGVVEQFESQNIGDPFAEETTMGSLVSRDHFETVCEYIDTALEEGAKLLTGGDTLDREAGHFVEPTVFEVDPEMTIATEEIFGPVLSVIEWEDYDELIDIANGVDYGLTASIWTSDLDRAHRTADDLEAGYVWINQHGTHYVGTPFGGYKQSGIRRKEDLQELLDHTQPKNINIEYESIRPS